MSTLIDRAASDLYAYFSTPSPLYSAYGTDLDCVILDGAFDLRKIVRVVVEAMREPTGEMMAACPKPVLVPFDMGSGGRPIMVPGLSSPTGVDMYRAMVDEALK